MKNTLLMVILMFVVVACQSSSDPTPVIVYVTATPQVIESPVAIVPSATTVPTETPLGIFPSATPTETIEGVPSPTPFSSPTPTVTLTPTDVITNTPTPFPTLTFTPNPLTENIAPGAQLGELAAFPTATGGAVETADVAATAARRTETAIAATATAAANQPAEITSNPYIEPTAGAGGGSVAQPPDAGNGPELPSASETPRPRPTVNTNIEVAEVVQPAAVSRLAPPPEELPILNADKIGVQLHPFVTNEAWSNALGLSRQLGMSWIKFQVPWDVSEPNPGDYSFQYQRLVLLVQEAHNRGYRVLLSVTRAPDWARPEGFNPNEEGPPADPAALANFVTKMITDIKPESMEAIEIWNEPNLEREWNGVQMDGATYMRYFEAAYNAARALDPTVIIVSAGLAPVGDLPGTRDDRAFLREMYAAGFGNFPQARLGIHPYGWANPPDAKCCPGGPWADNVKFFMRDTLDEYRQIMLDNNDAQRLVWITELGWGTFNGIMPDGSDATPPEVAGFFNFISLQDQAEYTVDALQILQTDPYDSYIEMTILWNMNFATIENAISDQLEQAGYSFLDAGGNPRLLFWYLLNTRKIYPLSRP